ncbi:MAG: glycosyl hydrolase family 18 protein [Syntrophobacteraceae bacterium]
MKIVFPGKRLGIGSGWRSSSRSLLTGLRRGVMWVGAAGVLLVICAHASGPDGSSGRPLQRWGYGLMDSLLNASRKLALEESARNFNVLCITGYRLGKDGRIHGPSPRAQGEITSLAAKSTSEIFPLVAFTSSSDGRILLASPVAREKARGELVELARSGIYAGIHLDFEYLPPEDAPKLAGFLRDLRADLNGRKLTMAVFPPLDFPAKWAGFHDLDAIGAFVDEIVLMCYDYHRPGTPAGPVVDLEWTKRNISRVLKSVRAEKVWLGMPAYGYDWSADGKTKVLPAREGVRLAEKHGAVRHASGTLFFRYADQRGGHEVYLADKETRRRMEDLAGSFGLKGVALWRLGFEEE